MTRELPRRERVCFGYGPSDGAPYENPAEFVAGFEAATSPLLWAAEGQGPDMPVVRVPNTAKATDPAWELADPQYCWWALTELGDSSVSHPSSRVRLAWSVPNFLAQPPTVAMDAGDGEGWKRQA